MKAIEYRITLTKTNIQIDEDRNKWTRLDAPPISATVTVGMNGDSEPLSPYDILDKLFNQIYGKLTEENSEVMERAGMEN